ncbi:glutamate--tRNA ligase [Patescibacteria group bacterium]|nr:glutamate--tRNA ligase [Patescibacteria group bacterium]
MSKEVVTRFAPSPTGKPHVGNIRTAIFAYLWAKHNQGKFLLRIEDTDRARLDPSSQKYIEESLAWLGLDYDEEMVFQSDRKNIHQDYANTLINKGAAYKCFCSKERLEKLREDQTKKKLPPGYDGLCRELTKEEIKKNESTPYVIRFKMPKSGKAVWNDGIRGKMAIDYKIADDPVIIKSDGWPTYHLASVIDDHEQEITDVIRGEEWISSTPKHIALYEAFNWKTPRFNHMPHINGPDGSKLSKRHGDTAILDYREKGYLPDAIFNFLALLGWNDGTEKEIFTRDELIKTFEIERIGRSPAVFDIKKLDWMDGQYIRASQTANLKKQITTLYPEEKIVKSDIFDKVLEVEKSRLSKLSDILEKTEHYITPSVYKTELLVFKKSNKEDTLRGLEAAMAKLEKGEWPKTAKRLNNLLAEIVNKTDLSNGDVFWPVRVALSGEEKSASPPELLWVIGKKESLERIKRAIKKLGE